MLQKLIKYLAVIFFIGITSLSAQNVTPNQQLSLLIHPGKMMSQPSSPRPAIDFNFAAEESLDSRITFTRASNKTCFDSSGVLQTLANNIPCFDHQPNAPNTSLGLLIEEQRTNLLVRSEEFDNGSWVKGGSTTVDPDQIVAPDGNTTADEIIFTSSTSDSISQTVSGENPVSATYIFSVYLKAVSARDVRIRLDSTSSGPLSTKSLTTDWQRISLTRTFGGSDIADVEANIFNSDPASTVVVHAWGAQLEKASFQTSYIATTTASVIRSADIASITGTNFSSWYNQSEGTFLVNFTVSSLSGGRRVFMLSDGTNNERIIFDILNSKTRMVVIDGNITQAALTATDNWVVDVQDSVIGAYKLNDFAFSDRGATVLVDGGGTLPTVNKIDIGQGLSATFLNGHISRLSYFNTRLPNSSLIDKSAFWLPANDNIMEASNDNMLYELASGE